MTQVYCLRNLWHSNLHITEVFECCDVACMKEKLTLAGSDEILMLNIHNKRIFSNEDLENRENHGGRYLVSLNQTGNT